MTNPPYGQFATGGTVETARSQGFSFAVPQQGRSGVDWIMLLTGCVLVYYTGKIMLHQYNRGIDGLEMPLWVGSTYIQAQHLLFNIQYDKDVRENLKKEYLSYKKSEVVNNRLGVSFFEYVQSRMPDFCSGRLNSVSDTMQIVLNALGNKDSQALVTFARSVQTALQRRGGDPQTRVDDFISKIGTLNGIRLGSTAAVNSAGGGIIPQNVIQANYSPPVNAPVYANTQYDSPTETNNLDSNSSQIHGSVPFQDK
ncbi:hypothetical protein STCU_05336 [Strigomonas culicis]|nr:hypothetical protein STCU_05336 [Strigomonas culicis]|eukprot:EPY28030.1 hypothetical protein STCU_05336 [Strigomonas culicis]